MGDSYNMDDFQKAIYNAVSVTRNTVCADCVVDVSDLSGTITGTDAGRAQYRYVKPENEGQKVYMEGMKEVLDYCNGNAEKKFLLDGFSFNYYKGSALETESYGPRNAVSFGTWFSNSPSAIEKWKNYFTEDDAAIYVIVYEDGNMENYPAIRMMSEQMQCPAVLDDRIDVSTGITYLVWRIGK